MVQAAVYDAVNAIEGTPAYYVQIAAPTGASAEAAVSMAAYNVLNYLYPARKAGFDALLATVNWIDLRWAVQDRRHDRRPSRRECFDRPASQRRIQHFCAIYPQQRPWPMADFTPPIFAQAMDPQWATLQPFAMTSDSQLRPGGTCSLVQPAMGRRFQRSQKLQQRDQRHSRRRSNGDCPLSGGWFRYCNSGRPLESDTAEQIAQQQGNSLADDARLFAELNIAMGDAAIVAWDAKYTYTSWRPITAIRAADTAGNSQVTADPNWTSLLVSPNFPEYVSGHSTYSAPPPQYWIPSSAIISASLIQ